MRFTLQVRKGGFTPLSIFIHSKSGISSAARYSSPSLAEINDRGSSGNAPTASSASMGDGPCLKNTFWCDYRGHWLKEPFLIAARNPLQTRPTRQVLAADLTTTSPQRGGRFTLPVEPNASTNYHISLHIPDCVEGF